MFPNCIALLLSSLTGGNVLNVSPTGPYTQIQDAVAAASDGDLVLVQGGTYGSFTVQAKSLTVVADTGVVVNVQGAASVLDLAAGQTVCLIGLRALGDPNPISSTGWGLHADGNLGSIRCERCQISAQAWNTDAAWIASSSDVSFVQCQFLGGIGDADLHGGAGVKAEACSLTFFDCTLQGGYGWNSDSIFPSGNGGQGLHAENCTVFSSSTSFTGGSGGLGQNPFIAIPKPGYGGAGVELVATSLMRVLDSTMVGGANGDWQTGGSAPAFVGGTFITLSGTKRTMTVPNPVRELTSLNFSFHGAPSENVYLLVGKDAGVQWDPNRNANFLIAPPSYRSLHVGTTDVNGDLTVQLPLGDLGSGVQSDMFYLQPLFSGAGGAQQLGTPVTLAVLDQAF